MSRAKKALAMLVVASLGLWGCARGPANGPSSVERIRALETKNAKLEDEFKAAVAVRDQLRKKLTTTEGQRDQATGQLEQLQAAAKERDQLRQDLAARSNEREALQNQLSSRTNERDAVQAQFEQFRKGIRTLLGQTEAAGAASTAQPVTSADPVTSLNKS